MKLKTIFFLLITISTLNHCFAKLIKIDKLNISAPSSLSDVEMFHSKKKFYIKKNGQFYNVQNCFVDKEIRNINSEQLQMLLGNIKIIEISGQKVSLIKISSEKQKDFFDIVKNSEITPTEITSEESEKIIKTLSQSAYIKIGQLDNGEYTLTLCQRLCGGGVWGAVGGVWAGKFLASAVCHTGIFLVGGAVSLVATPAVGGIVIASLETTLGPTIEAFTTTVALAAGITGAVLTGPV